MRNFLMCFQGVVALMFHRWKVLDDLIIPETDDMWLPLRAILFIKAFLELTLHIMLLLALLRERCWRSVVTLWLYLGYRLAILHTGVAVFTAFTGFGSVKYELALAVGLWFTWFHAYQYVEEDQKARDLQRQSDSRGGGEDTTDGDQVEGVAGQQLVSLDPTGLYLLTPSHSDPPLTQTPTWEQDLDSWRSMARLSFIIDSGFEETAVTIASAISALAARLNLEEQ